MEPEEKALVAFFGAVAIAAAVGIIVKEIDPPDPEEYVPYCLDMETLADRPCE